jgi:cytochrome c2
MSRSKISIPAIVGVILFALAPTAVYPSGDHDGGHDEPLETMREMHSSHEHEHDFGVMDEMTGEQRERLNSFMTSVGLVMPPMSSHRGREIFLEKGCVVCHSINGVGGEIGPNLDAADMPSPMNAFEFAARMWRGAPAMVLMQEEQLGEFVNLTGEELADLVAFVHDAEEQEELSIDQVPEQFLTMINP